MKRIIFLLFLFQIFSVTTILASDNIVINEFLPHPSSGSDWVELFNPTNNNVDISGWVITDSTTNKITIPSGTVLNAKQFIYYTFSNRLDNGGDTVKLKVSEGSANSIDEKNYSADPGIGISIGRNPDGEDNWITFNTPTPGSTNNPASPTPTLTPIPTVTSTATPTISPTILPSPTVTPQITISPTPTAITAPLTPPMNIHEILEKRMQCRFSYSRFAKLPNGAMLIEVLKNFFGKNSVCSP